MSVSITDISAKISNGVRLSRKEGELLYLQGDLPLLGHLANLVRARFNPQGRATFLIDRNINYTNVCNTDCNFCGFYRPNSKHPESYVLSKQDIGSKIEEALALGATRILLQGGHNDELPYAFYTDLISWITSKYTIEVNAFSPSEIIQISKVASKEPFEVLTDLKACGMKGLPGGGAEILDDQIRKRVSPKKISAQEWIDIMAMAQELRLTTTATMVIGFGEELTHRLNHLDRVRDLQDRSRAEGLEGFNAFIAWPLQHNQNTSMGRSRHKDSFGASSTEYLRHIAFSRIYLDNIPHHQASWPTLGPEIAKIGLHFGCDDIGSTMMEENVVSQAGAPSLVQCSMSPEQLREFIEDAGFTAAQRNTSFEIVRTFSAGE